MYTDPIIKQYIDLIVSKTNVFNKIYQGEPTRIGASVLPCLLISKRATEAIDFDSARDEHECALDFTVVADIRQELSTSENDESVIAGVARLYEIMEGREADLTLKANSLLGILRNNQLVSASLGLRTDLGGATRVDYGETLQSRQEGEWRIQASISIIAKFHQVR